MDVRSRGKDSLRLRGRGSVGRGKGRGRDVLDEHGVYGSIVCRPEGEMGIEGNGEAWAD